MYDWDIINKTNKQTSSRDMEMKNKLAVTRGGEGITGERRGPKDKDMGWGVSLGAGVGWDRQEQWGEMGTTITEQQ